MSNIRFVSNVEGWEEVCLAPAKILAQRTMNLCKESDAYLRHNAIKIDNYTIIVRAQQESAVVIITKDKVKFLTHPRTGSLRLQPYFDNQGNQYYLTGIDGGGWREDLSELANRYTYPLQDDDKGTWGITPEEVLIEWAENENYGNCYWWDGQVDGQVLSWKGPPNGLSISGMYNIPGVSQQEVGGTTPLYTTFGVYIYQDGEYLCHGPQWFEDDEMKTLVAGAMYINSVLCCLTITNKTPGFYLQLWKTEDSGANWLLQKEAVVGTRLRLSAQISKDGKSFVYDGVLYKIADDLSGFEKVEEIDTSVSGTMEVIGPGGYGSKYNYSGTKAIWSGMGVDGKLYHSLLDVSAKFGYSTSGGGGYQKSDQPVYRGNPATAIVVSQEGVYANGELYFKAEANGSYCSISWSGVDRVENGYGIKKLTQCNSNFSITATAQPQGVVGTLVRDVVVGDIAVSGPQGSVGSGSGGNPDSPVSAGQYTATNAVGRITWSNDKGTISSGGYAVFSGCGTATITASDDCGRTASLPVIIGSGSWVWQSRTQDSSSCSGHSGNLGEYASIYTSNASYRVGSVVYVIGILSPNTIGLGDCPHNGWFPSDFAIGCWDASRAYGSTTALNELVSLGYITRPGGGSQYHLWTDFYRWTC